MLHSGEMPLLSHTFGEGDGKAKGEIIDALDVADLDSEKEHAYCVKSDPERRSFRDWPYPWNPYREKLYEGLKSPVADGGREVSGVEMFTMKVDPARAAILVVRTDNPAEVRLQVAINGKDAGMWTIPAAPPSSSNPHEHLWHEPEFVIDTSLLQGNSIQVTIRCLWSHVGTGDIHRTFHYWLIQPQSEQEVE
jgi:hypothetical protein